MHSFGMVCHPGRGDWGDVDSQTSALIYYNALLHLFTFFPDSFVPSPEEGGEAWSGRACELGGVAAQHSGSHGTDSSEAAKTMGLRPGLGGDKRANENLSTGEGGKGGTLSF